MEALYKTVLLLSSNMRLSHTFSPFDKREGRCLLSYFTGCETESERLALLLSLRGVSY